MEIVPLDEQNRSLILARVKELGVLPQQHPVWVDILTAMGEDCRGFLALDGERALGWLYYTIRTEQYGTVINSMPYIAYGGPATPDMQISAVQPLLQALRAEAETLDADVLSLGSSPWLSKEIEAVYRQTLGVTHELENFVQLHELIAHPLSLLSKKRRSSFQSEINRAKQAGFECRPLSSDKHILEWLDIYNNRYHEIGAKPYPDLFHQLAFELGIPAGAVQLWGVFDGPKLIGGNLLLVSRYYVDYFSSAFLSEYRHYYPNTFSLNKVFSDFVSHDKVNFNWQSSPNRLGVFRYKQRWGAREWRHYYLSVLLRPETLMFQTTPANIKAAFPFRFVLPYSAWSQSAAARM